VSGGSVDAHLQSVPALERLVGSIGVPVTAGKCTKPLRAAGRMFEVFIPFSRWAVGYPGLKNRGRLPISRIMVAISRIRRAGRPWLGIGSFVTASALALAVVVPALASNTQTPLKRQTKRQAEITLLHAGRALAALSPRLVDPRTRLVRTNTRAVCKGLGRGKNGMFVRFRCLIANGNARFLVSYVAFGQNGRILRKIATLSG
jgi:hypothetical protein